MQAQVWLCDLDLGFDATDERRVDLVARGLPLFGGVPVCGDSSMTSVLHCDGKPWVGATDNDGVAIQRARRAHETTYPELVRGGRGRLAAGLGSGRPLG